MGSPPPNPHSIFVDSSVLLAASLSASGPARELIILGLRGHCRLFLTQLVLEETLRNVVKKAPQASTAFLELRGLLYTVLIEDPELALVERVAAVVELKDAAIVAGAIAGGADFLVTHDVKHLLREAGTIRSHFRVSVVSPGEVLHLIRPG